MRMPGLELTACIEPAAFDIGALKARTNTAMDFATLSIAISLKRIADSLENINEVFDSLSSRNRT